MSLSCYVPSQIIPKSRIVHLADKRILKRHILSYPKIIVSKNPPGGGEGGRVSIPGPWTISPVLFVGAQASRVSVYLSAFTVLSVVFIEFLSLSLFFFFFS